LIKAIITKKKFRILFFHKIQKMMKKKSSKYKNIESKKKIQKKNPQNSITKKNQQNPTKTKKLAARGGSPQPHSSINRAEKTSNLNDVHNSL